MEDANMLENAAKVIDEHNANNPVETPEVPAQEPAVETPDKEAPEAPADEAPEVDEPKLGEALGDEPEYDDEPEEPSEEMVPLSAHLKLKSQLRELKELERAGKLDNVTPDNISALAEQYGANPELLQHIVALAEQNAAKQFEERYAPVIEDIQEEKLEAEKNKSFNQLWDITIKNNPEFEGVANKSVMKQLAFLEINSQKSLAQVIRETYGDALKSETPKKASVDTNTGKSRPIVKDFNDPNVLKDIKNDKKLQEDYAQHLIDNYR